MASENKTEKATPFRRAKLREEGNILKSAELTAAIIILSSVGIIFFIGYKIAVLFIYSFTSSSSLIEENPNSLNNFNFYLKSSFFEAFKVILPFFILAIILSVLSNIVQFGFLFTLKPLIPKFDKLNIINGIKNLVNINSFFELSKNTLKIVILLIASFVIIYNNVNIIESASFMSIQGALESISILIFKLLITIGIISLIIAGMDFLYKKQDFENKIKMSKQEVKDELKQFEGNLEVKGKIRQKMRQLARQRMMQEVPKASVVITNPTHFAVALKYNEKEDNAPKVIAKGQDYLALKIKEIATAHDVPIVEEKELARALYLSVEIGEEIPPNFYKAVAKIIAFVVRKRKNYK